MRERKNKGSKETRACEDAQQLADDDMKSHDGHAGSLGPGTQVRKEVGVGWLPDVHRAASAPYSDTQRWGIHDKEKREYNAETQSPQRSAEKS